MSYLALASGEIQTKESMVKIAFSLKLGGHDFEYGSYIGVDAWLFTS
jgi:hypothetical protein